MSADESEAKKKMPATTTARLTKEAYADIMACRREGEGWADVVRFVAKFARKFFDQFGRAGMEGLLEGSIEFTPGQLFKSGSYKTSTTITEKPGLPDVVIGGGAKPKISRPPRSKPAPGSGL